MKESGNGFSSVLRVFDVGIRPVRIEENVSQNGSVARKTRWGRGTDKKAGVRIFVCVCVCARANLTAVVHICPQLRACCYWFLAGRVGLCDCRRRDDRTPRSNVIGRSFLRICATLRVGTWRNVVVKGRCVSQRLGRRNGLYRPQSLIEGLLQVVLAFSPLITTNVAEKYLWDRVMPCACSQWAVPVPNLSVVPLAGLPYRKQTPGNVKLNLLCLQRRKKNIDN